MALVFAIFGIGLILFVHEGGHYLAARFCGVRVEVFSLGFGPRVWGFQRGGTDYRLSLLPLGGYVRLAGEETNQEPKPGELGAAGKGQRLLIFAGGILMNFVFAALVLPILFRFGVPFEAPLVGEVKPGSVAWHAGVLEGDRILETGGRTTHAFRHFAAAVALGGAEPLVIRLLPGDKLGLPPRELVLVPEFDASVGFPRVGISPALFASELVVKVTEEGAAAQAGILDGDVLQSLDRIPIQGDPTKARILLQRALLRGGSVALDLLRQNNGEGPQQVQVVLHPNPRSTDRDQIGIRRRSAHVREILSGKIPLGLREGDDLLRAGGRSCNSLVDLAASSLRNGLPVLEVRRDGAVLSLPAQPDLKYPELLARVWLDGGDSFEVAPISDSPAGRSAMQAGDLLLRANGEPISDLQDLALAVQTQPQELDLVLLRPGTEDPYTVSLTAEASSNADYGFGLQGPQEIVRCDNIPDAIALGLREAVGMGREVLLTMRGMFDGSVAKKNLGGIIMIGDVAQSFASQGLIPLLLFLALISINLGILNLLPIPGLDGGHILFVLIEMVRGRPLSLRIQGLVQMVGLLAVLFLIVFVTWLDVQRYFG